MKETDPEPISYNKIKSKISKILGLKTEAPKNITQLQALISESEKTMQLPQDVASMINGVLQVSEMRVGDIMIPRSQMQTLNMHDSNEEYIKTITKTLHSRFPVIDGSMDKVAGVLLAKDLLHWSMQNSEANKKQLKITDVLRKPIFVPETKRLNVMLQEFKNNRDHLAIVVDEYGGTAGLVTIEDVLEQIVGDISDEHDIEDENNILQHSKTRHTVKATTSLEEFNQYFKTNFKTDEINTIGGFVVQSLGHLPTRNQTLNVNNIRFKILNSDKRRVHLLQVNIERESLEV